LGFGWGVGVRKGDSEYSGVEEDEGGNWEKRWRVEEVLGVRGIAVVERSSERWAEAVCEAVMVSNKNWRREWE
jgi:hypothetical protein